MKKLCLLVMLLVSLFAFSVQGFADEGAPIYNHRIDEKTSYTEPKGDNIGLITMIKPAYTEEYEIQYFKDWFVVLSVHADNEARTRDLQSEVGVKQGYGPNPRVNSVKEALERGNFFPKDLANAYPKAMIQSQEAAAEHLKNYIFGPNQLNLPQRWYVQNGNVYRPEYQGSLMQYEFFIMAGDNVFAEIVINENGEIYRRTKYEITKIN